MDFLVHFGITDARKLTWSHATNSRALLLAALTGESGVMVIEADIMGDVHGVPIMAHPPHRTSDLTFSEFITTIFRHNQSSRRQQIGIKLDFKDPYVVKICFDILQHLLSSLNLNLPPLILNADIWVGPGNKPSQFNPREFLEMCQSRFPSAVVSPGWTTDLSGALGLPAATETYLPSASYSRKHTSQAVAMSQAGLFSQDDGTSMQVTFPVNAVYAARNPTVLLDLLQTNSSYSLTIWGEETFVEREAINQLWKQSGGRIFVDTYPSGKSLLQFFFENRSILFLYFNECLSIHRRIYIHIYVTIYIDSFGEKCVTLLNRNIYAKFTQSIPGKKKIQN
jgi:hypothetical protein